MSRDLQCCDRNTIADNWVGIDAGEGPLGNVNEGILVTVGASDNVVTGNVVGANGGHGIHLRNAGTDGNVVTGNTIGLAPDGVTPRSNSGHGVLIEDQATGNRIGGISPAEANLVAHNGGDGVSLPDRRHGLSLPSSVGTGLCTPSLIHCS